MTSTTWRVVGDAYATDAMTTRRRSRQRQLPPSFHGRIGHIRSKRYNDKADLNTANDVGATAGATTTGIDVVLAAAGHVTGKVSNAGGIGLAGIGVTVYQWSDINDDWDWVSDATTVSDGTYDLGGLASGNCRLMFQTGQRAPTSPSTTPARRTLNAADDVSVTAGSTTRGNRRRAEPGWCGITGTVTIGGGDPGWVQVLCYDAEGDFVTQDFTGREEGHPDGAYVLGGLPSGSYRVAFNFDGVLQKYYDGKDSFETADPIVVTVDETISASTTTSQVRPSPA